MPKKRDELMTGELSRGQCLRNYSKRIALHYYKLRSGSHKYGKERGKLKQKVSRSLANLSVISLSAISSL